MPEIITVTQEQYDRISSKKAVFERYKDPTLPYPTLVVGWLHDGDHVVITPPPVSVTYG